MAIRTRTASALSVAFIFGASAAHADLTAQDVWDEWLSFMNLYSGVEGAPVLSIGSESMSGDTLVISDMQITASDATTEMVMTFPEYRFREVGDGSVEITMAESAMMTITGTSEFGEPGAADISITNSGTLVTATGDPGAINYAVQSDSYRIAVEEIREGATVIPLVAELSLTDLGGEYRTRMGDMQQVAYDVSVGGISLLIDADLPEEETVVDVSASVSDLALQAQVALPAEMDMENPDNALQDGLAVRGGYTVGGTEFDFAVQDAMQSASGQGSLASSSFSLNLSKEALRYRAGSEGLMLSVQATDLPVPVDIELADYALGFAVPLAADPEPQEFGMLFTLRDLAVSDFLWNMFDPGEVLPRLPATVDFELSGLTTLFVDLTNPQQAEAIAFGEVPGEINSVVLERLLVSVLGAELTGEGDFTFDNSDMATFDGIPRPEGDAFFRLSGLNAVLDSLVQMGILPEDMIMGPRMMMGMFANAVGDDVLESTVEINADGHLIVNGQRLQ